MRWRRWDYLDADPARIDPVHVDALAFRGLFRLLAGDLTGAVPDLRTSLDMVRQGATFTLGLRAYCALTLVRYLTGAWDDALLTAEAGVLRGRDPRPALRTAITAPRRWLRARRDEGDAEEAERHAVLAEQAAASLDYGQERLYAAVIRALVCQAAGDYAGMVTALGPWRDDATVDGRAQVYSLLWRPLLVEGLIGSGESAEAALALTYLQARGRPVSYLQPALAWLQGWLAEERGSPEAAGAIYQQGEDADPGDSPVYTARLLLAHGRLLRRTGARRPAIERLRRANALFAGLRAEPFLARTEEELAACGLTRGHARKRPVTAMTARETEVAHLVARGLTNVEVAAELFITPKAVAYHLGNIYAKFGLTGRQQLRRALAGNS